MESLLIIVSTVLLLSFDLHLVKTNRQLFALPVSGESGLSPNPGWVSLLNQSAWWSALAGAVLSAPLLILLAFNPTSDRWNWSLAPGLIGIVLIVLAAGLVLPVLVQQCARHHLMIKKMAANLIQHRLKPFIQRYGVKAGLTVLAALLLSPLIPYLLELVKFIIYAAGLFLAGRLGIFDHEIDDSDCSIPLGFLDYSTGKWDEYGSTAYRIYHED